MMKNITYIVGISASGKSTLTEQLVINDPKYIRCNRDALREAFVPNHNEKWYSEEHKEFRADREDLISHLLKAIELSNDFLIDDNTNLSWHFLEKALRGRNMVDVIITGASFDPYLCIDRDAKRDRIVGETIILKQYREFITLLVSLHDFIEANPDFSKNIKILEKDGRYNDFFSKGS